MENEQEILDLQDQIIRLVQQKSDIEATIEYLEKRLNKLMSDITGPQPNE